MLTGQLYRSVSSSPNGRPITRSVFSHATPIAAYCSVPKQQRAVAAALVAKYSRGLGAGGTTASPTAVVSSVAAVSEAVAASSMDRGWFTPEESSLHGCCFWETRRREVGRRSRPCV